MARRSSSESSLLGTVDCEAVRGHLNVLLGCVVRQVPKDRVGVGLSTRRKDKLNRPEFLHRYYLINAAQE